jgi:3-hydroxybutyryl-CoA dehydratase
MKFEFLAPVYIGDTVTAVATIAAADEKTGGVVLDCLITNIEDVEVLRATVTGFPGRFEDEGE